MLSLSLIPSLASPLYKLTYSAHFYLPAWAPHNDAEFHLNVLKYCGKEGVCSYDRFFEELCFYVDLEF
jgi:hypothetical protein